MVSRSFAILYVLARDGRMSRSRLKELAGPLCGGFPGSSIYWTLGQLHGAGLVADAARPRYGGRRGERWYKLSGAGRRHLNDLVYQADLLAGLVRDLSKCPSN